MRERIRLFLATCFYYSGVLKIAHWWTRRGGPRLIILNYHRAVGKFLPEQMRYLRRHYRIMHLEDALNEFFAPTQEQRARKAARDRRIPLVLTFDDGYLDNYTEGLRLARELEVPMTIFLVPGYVESGKCFWWRAGEYLVNSSKIDKVIINGQAYSLEQQKDRLALIEAISSHVWHAQSIAEREQFLADVQKALNVTLPERSTAACSDTSLPLSWNEIREMEQSGWVSFGAHTMHHPVLSCLNDVNEVRREVTLCRQVLEEQLGHPIRTFAYPIGKLRHIGDEGVQAVRDAGYTWALTTIEKINAPQTDPYLLRRLPGDEDLHWLLMAAELVGLLGILSRLRKRR
ncbi:polysaccharide deacetylase family protein [Ktedonosporobacter rubrisoli]|uniref:Polysaccharide deacetylase family protein n=1 Tax=Ktedonosporobacter rubrisoli TaxID=2509675 RepID=A0A4P6JSJ8_KTERU|nr:polysaccharide deacetylase family protein [Ktedonosporobacter rubrisoli]QBD78384.1 polysaccharide deacetylase family protein [Ktedonosporobacter rubrisoli]